MSQINLLALHDEHGAFADALAEVVELGAAGFSAALHGVFLHVGAVDRENALNALAGGMPVSSPVSQIEPDDGSNHTPGENEGDDIAEVSHGEL